MDSKDQPYHNPSARNAGNGQTVLDSSPSDLPMYDTISSAPPSHPADPNSQPNPTRDGMAYAAPLPPQRQLRVDYQVPFGATAVPIQCPACQQRTVSKVKHVSGGYTFCWALGLCAVVGLGCIPFCVGRLKNVEHWCGECNQKLVPCGLIVFVRQRVSSMTVSDTFQYQSTTSAQL